MLAQTLRVLEGDGFVLRVSAGTVPPRVDYSLTPLGSELAALLVPLVQWVGDNVGRIPSEPLPVSSAWPSGRSAGR